MLSLVNLVHRITAYVRISVTAYVRTYHSVEDYVANVRYTTRNT